MSLQPLVPASPRSNVLRVRFIEVFEETDERMLTRFHRGWTEAEREDECSVGRLQINFASDRDIAVLRPGVCAVEPLVGVQLLPSVREAHESDRTREPRRCGSERECVMISFGEQQRRPLVIPDPG